MWAIGIDWKKRRTLAAAASLVMTLVIAADGRAFDGEMICAWRRTFYAPNYVNMPLRPYNMPRIPNCNCWGAIPSDWQVAGESCVMSQGFERLGRVPNDLSFSPLSVGATTGQ